MSDKRREIRPVEMEAIFHLANDYANLADVPNIIAELEQRVDDLTALTIGAASVQPKSIDDLLKLRTAKLVSDDWIKQRLGLDPAPERAPETASSHVDGRDPGYVVRDRRVTG